MKLPTKQKGEAPCETPPSAVRIRKELVSAPVRNLVTLELSASNELGPLPTS
jgi:hypothetical protein